MAVTDTSMKTACTEGGSPAGVHEAGPESGPAVIMLANMSQEDTMASSRTTVAPNALQPEGLACLGRRWSSALLLAGLPGAGTCRGWHCPRAAPCPPPLTPASPAPF